MPRAGASMHGRARPSEAWLPAATYLVAVAIMFAALGYFGQLHTPYIEHDDWNFLIPESFGKGYATPWQKTLTEGRWINYWWYLLIGVRWSATAAVAAGTACVAVFACALASGVEGHARRLLLALALFFSPIFAELSVWPAVLAASRLLLALAVLWLAWPRAGGKWVALGLATFLAVMSYAGVAPIILLAFVFLRQVERKRELLAAVVVYLVAYVLSVLAIATLNSVWNEHFGVIIEGWRKPHPAYDLASFWNNCLLQLEYLGQRGAFLRVPLLVAAVAALFALHAGPRKRVEAVLLVAAMAFAMDVGMAGLAGVHVPVRSMAWLWVTMALMAAFAWESRDRRARTGAWACAALLLVLGALDWRGEYRVRQPAGDLVYAIGAAAASQNAGREIVLAGDVRSVGPLYLLFDDPHTNLRMAWFKAFHLDARSCRDTECAALARYAAQQGVRDLIFPWDGKLVVYFRPGAAMP